jgi:hypothetical protein
MSAAVAPDRFVRGGFVRDRFAPGRLVQCRRVLIRFAGR